MKNMNNIKKRMPVIAVIAAVCVTGLIAASASSFADMIGDNNKKDVSSKINDKIASTNQYIGEDAAKKIVIAKVSGSAIENITEFYLEHDDGKATYDGEMYFKNVKYEFEIDAVDGTILEWEQENKKTTSPGAIDATSSATTKSGTGSVNSGDNRTVNTSAYIGIAKVKEILLLKVPGATITEIDLEFDDGVVKYEGELYLNNFEYEFEIDAVTGAVLEWELDSKDDLDDDDDDSDDDDDDSDDDDAEDVNDDSDDDDEEDED